MLEHTTRSRLALAALLLLAATASPQQLPPAPQDQPAEAVFKNIQALQSMRAGELQGAMSFIASSLNVDCDYCHVQNFDSDEKKEKVRAREMIRMVRQINEGTFHGENTVNCFTCHQGHAKPISVAPLSLLPPVRQKAVETAAAATPAPTELPSVDQVLSRYVQALGGQAALDGVKTRVVQTARLNSPDKLFGVIYQKAPGKILIAHETPSYSAWAGCDGARSWGQDSLKSYWGILNTAQRNALMRDAEMYPGSRIKSAYAEVKVARREKIGERDTLVVEGISPEKTREEFFFDAENGLLLRRHIVEETIFGPFQIQGDFEDYRDAGGTKMAYTVKWTSPGGAWGVRTSTKVMDVKVNEPIDDKFFAGAPQN